MTEANAKVIAHSVSPEGFQIYSIQETFWRPVLAERNTHGLHRKNSNSSRAMSFEGQLRKFIDDPADPLEWRAEERGMQGGAHLAGKDLEDAKDLWYGIKIDIVNRLGEYIDKHPDKRTRLHKSWLNRILEFGQWHTVCVTASSWQNYFDQRCHEDAQPEIRAVALAARDAIEASKPRELAHGEWHTPYVDLEEGEDWTWDETCRISTARVARTSYDTHEGKRDKDVDLGLYARLVDDQLEREAPVHWSPLEQVVTPWKDNKQYGYAHYKSGDTELFVPTKHLPRVGPFPGWLTYRTKVETELSINTYR